MNALLFCCLAQIVSFDSKPGYAIVTGDPDSVVRFYDDWADYAWPEQDVRMCDQRDYIVYEAKRSGRCVFATDSTTRMALAQTIILRGYTVRFLVDVHPFGSFWVYYNSIGHVVVTFVGLAGLFWWMKRRSRSVANES